MANKLQPEEIKTIAAIAEQVMEQLVPALNLLSDRLHLEHSVRCTRSGMLTALSILAVQTAGCHKLSDRDEQALASDVSRFILRRLGLEATTALTFPEEAN